MSTIDIGIAETPVRSVLNSSVSQRPQSVPTPLVADFYVGSVKIEPLSLHPAKNETPVARVG
jgi:hypothetical protein